MVREIQNGRLIENLEGGRNTGELRLGTVKRGPKFFH